MKELAAVLFDDLQQFPEGFVYRADFISEEEEEALMAQVREQEFHDVQMRGVIARRRVIQYGWKYKFDRTRLSPGPELPAFLLPIRDRAAELAGVDAGELSEGLLTEYQSGAPIGWHRDAPGFGIIVGISLLSDCRFRFRRGSGADIERVSLTLARRSAYVLSGPARSEWQHSIPEVSTLRYSITFRTLAR
jgi:alkylated DNA repair dioxygenase AlkB